MNNSVVSVLDVHLLTSKTLCQRARKPSDDWESGFLPSEQSISTQPNEQPRERRSFCQSPRATFHFRSMWNSGRWTVAIPCSQKRCELGGQRKWTLPWSSQHDLEFRGIQDEQLQR